jgi:hypothetical protein
MSINLTKACVSPDCDLHELNVCEKASGISTEGFDTVII